MSNEEEVIVDPINEEEEEVETIEENPPEVQPERPIETPEAKAARLLRQTNQQRKRLGLPPLVEAKPEVKEEAKGTLVSIQDLHALRNVHEDDINEVQEYAKFKGISVKEALGTSVIKTLLAEKEEQRKVAEATSTRTSRMGYSEPSDEEILEKAYKGELSSPEKMAEIRQRQRLNNKSKG